MAQVPSENFPFCGPFSVATSPYIDAQNSINLYPELGIRGSRTAMGLVGRPGLGFNGNAFCTTINSPCRSLWAGHQRMFTVGGSHVYEIDPFGVIITDWGPLTASTGVGYAKFACNSGAGFIAGNQLLVFDSSCNSLFSLQAGGGAGFTKVFNGTALEFLDNYFVSIATGASLVNANIPNQINCANFGLGGAAADWNALNFVYRTGAADFVNGLAVLNSLLWIFGEKTTEIWYNAGNAPFPFARINGGQIGLGLLSPASLVKFNNTIMWLGVDDLGYAQVYMSRGTTPVKVSTPAVENYLTTTPLVILTGTRSYGYQEAGHTFYCLNVPGLTKTQMVYDLTTGLWHQRTYAGAFPVTSCCLPGFATNQQVVFVGDNTAGKIWAQSTTYPNDGTGNAITYQRIAPHLCNHNLKTTYNRLEVSADIGTAAMALDYSNNGGKSFLGYNYPMKQATDASIPGSFPRYYYDQLGQSRDRVFSVSVSSSTQLVRLADAYLDADEDLPR